MKLLVTGNYDPNYNRTQILLKGLRNNPHLELTEFPIANLKRMDSAALKKMADAADFIYLPPFTHESVKKIKKLTTTPLVFDPLISKYLTKVFDYQQVSKYSPRAYKNYLKDKIPLHLADLIIADTAAHSNYFSTQFKLKPSKIHVLPIGADVHQFKPMEQEKSAVFTVGFYGGFIPLQGTQAILETAQLLQDEKDIHFSLIGTGFEWEKMKDLAKKFNLSNLSFEGWVAYEKLPAKINAFDLCLGIFGNTPKADLVIPNKIYHYAALNKCILTKNTPAIQEVFSDQKNIILTDTSPASIAKQILSLKNNPDLTRTIAKNAHNLITTELNQDKIADQFIGILEQYSC